MKNLLMVLMVALVAALAFAGPAQADPAYVPVTPYMNGNTCVIPALPAGAKLLNVQLYNDRTGMKPKNLGAVSQFALRPGEGFNFTWEGREPNDGKTGIWWQFIGPRSVAGAGLSVVCFSGPHPDCKYERPLENQ